VGWGEVLVALFTLLFGGVGGGFVIGLRRDRRQGAKERAELFDVLRQAQVAVVADLTSQIERLAAERDEEVQRREKLEADLDAVKKDFGRRLAIMESARDFERYAAVDAIRWASRLLDYIAHHLPEARDVPLPSVRLKEYMGEVTSQ